jgi:hypothetical protein
MASATPKDAAICRNGKSAAVASAACALLWSSTANAQPSSAAMP